MSKGQYLVDDDCLEVVGDHISGEVISGSVCVQCR